ncbi:MAG: serralysin [Yoonia sp.]
MSNTGNVVAADTIGTDDGLWASAITGIEIATIGTQTYVIVAAAGSSSLSVMTLDGAGQMAVTDHVIDTLHSRFASVSAITVVEHHGDIYVIAGGADDGLSLFMLRADGTLLARGHIADTTQMGLENVSAITAVSVGNGIDIFAASSAVAGITQLHFDTGPAGLTLNAGPLDPVLSGAAGMDIINGGTGADRLSGGRGDDIISDGAGVDRMTGGAGADTFIIAYDTDTDMITDFVQGVDQIDLSAWPGLRSTAQLTFTPRADGIRISYGDDVLIVISADGQPIDPANFGATAWIGDARIAQNITPGFAGPAGEVPDLPERAEYIPYVYTPAAVDPNADTGEVFIPADTTMTGSSAADTMNATSQLTTLYGMGGADRMTGTGADNNLYGGSGADTIYGRGGDDDIWGNEGADRLIGNGGNDTMTGGRGSDTFIFTDGHDTITDFSNHTDMLHLDDKNWRGNLNALVDAISIV